MKNSKRFPDQRWMVDSFLTSAQLATCQTLLLADPSALTLAVVDLGGLAAGRELHGQQLLDAYLSSIEQERLATFSFVKRQHEWLGGRIAAKTAALRLRPPPLLLGSFPAIQVVNDSDGRPFLSFCAAEGDAPEGDVPLPHLSISHSGHIAAALAVDGRLCGLDVQTIHPKVIAVRDRFCSPREQALLRSIPLLGEKSAEEAFSLLWSAKEALRKTFAGTPLLGFMEAQLCAMEPVDHGGIIARFRCPRQAAAPVSVFLARSGAYVCAIAVSPPDWSPTP